MSVVRLKHVDRFTDRHGRQRYYFRRGKGVRIMLPGKPGSAEFMLAYQAAVAGQEVCKPSAQRGEAGTFDRLVQEYYASMDFVRLKGETQRQYRVLIDRMVREENIGHRRVGEMTREHVQKIMARYASTPAGANDRLRKLKILLHFAIDHGWRRDDPTLRMKRFEVGEYHTWTDEEIAQFEARWPLGTRERTGFALLLFTGQRISDVARMSWADVQGAAIWVVQQKTGAKLLVPMHPALQSALAAWPRTNLLMLATVTGRPFLGNRLTVFMSKAIDAAGLADRCVPHGLRKAASRRLAEAGCSSKEIGAITGHTTLKEIERYTRAAEQKKLAQAAMDRLEKQDANKNSQT